MKVLIIQGGANSKLPSGEKTVILNELKYLSIKHDVHVECLNNKDGIISKLSGVVWSYSNYNKVVKLIEKYQPDIVHFHTIVPYLSLSVLYAAKRKNVRVVQTLHNVRWLCVEGGFHRKGKYCNDCVGSYGWKGVQRGCGRGRFSAFLIYLVNLYARSTHLFNLVDNFVAVSDFIRNNHIQSGFPESKLIVNNNGIDIDQIKYILDKNLQKNRLGIAFAGRISVAKGSDVLKYVIPVIKQPFHIIGDGPNSNDLKQFCKENSYKHVVFWGKQSREKTLEILNTVVCTIIPSQCGESFSMVAAESMALGVPVVASDLGGLSDLVKAGGGVVVNSRKFNQFNEAILRYIEHPSLAKEHGKSGQRYVFKYLSNEVRSEVSIDNYKKLTN